MPITSALPGLWAGFVAAAALAGVTLYQRPAPQADAMPAHETVQELVQTDSIVTTLFGEAGPVGHVTMALSYRIEADAPPAVPLAALASDRLAQAALEQTAAFAEALDDDDALAAFVKQSLATMRGYRVEGVVQPEFHPFVADQ